MTVSVGKYRPLSVYACVGSGPVASVVPSPSKSQAYPAIDPSGSREAPDPKVTSSPAGPLLTFGSASAIGGALAAIGMKAWSAVS